MSLKTNVRQSSDVAILDLNGRLSLGEALAFGPGSGLVLSETHSRIDQEGPKEDFTQPCRRDLRRQFWRRAARWCVDDCA